ncbi:MAG: HPr family phosphocarrier protein [Hyphomonas sp.]|jgi:phosphocarrier protein HPr|uniref:HPr family phosphocarrier protein n=1 Tax=Hyphomonas sp. TaxID=87 RepID=UPI0037C04659|nr:HPr family phosphocarrier protein [Hyphomonas sp.]
MSDPFPAARRATIVNRKGLHARASAKLAKLAAEYDAQVFVTHESETADARSIMDLLMLVAHAGCIVEIKGRGAQADEAVTAIARLIDEGFGENDG